MTIDLQPDLFAYAESDERVRDFELLLEGQADWVTTADLAEMTGRECTESYKRIPRALASASGWIISGQRGYRHLKHATAEEVQRCCATMESEAKKLAERAARLRRNSHRIFG
jgi:hypothetical protein